MGKRTLTAEERQILLSTLHREAIMINNCIIAMQERKGDHIEMLTHYDSHCSALAGITWLFNYMFDCEIVMPTKDAFFTSVSVDGETKEVDSYVEKEEL